MDRETDRDAATQSREGGDDVSGEGAREEKALIRARCFSIITLVSV